MTHLFAISGDSALPASSTPFAHMGLLERNLQQWVVANPGVLGPGVMIVAAECDTWAGTGARRRPRVDVLGLHESGQLVVVELKRDAADRSVHAQALTYAALAARFDLSSLAATHQRFLARGGLPVTEDEARQRLLQHVGRAPGDDLDRSRLEHPRIVLVAGSYPQDVSASADFLTRNGIEVTLVQVQVWRSGQGDFATFTTVYPVHDPVEAIDRGPVQRPTRRPDGPRNPGRPGRHTPTGAPAPHSAGNPPSRSTPTLRAG